MIIQGIGEIYTAVKENEDVKGQAAGGRAIKGGKEHYSL